MNSDPPDTDPCPTELCVSPAAVAGLVASRTAVSHPGWHVLALICAQAGGASQLTCTLVVVPCSPIHIHCTQQSALHTSEVIDETSLKAAGSFLTFSCYI